jgi:hypothetical protein
MDLQKIDKDLREAVANIVRAHGGTLTVGGGDGHWSVTWVVDSDTCLEIKYDKPNDTLHVYDISCGEVSNTRVSFYQWQPGVGRLERAILVVI